jgi:hypothetical protein
MTEYVKKKRGRKPKNKIMINTIINDVQNENKSEDENIILHLPITMNDINNVPSIKSYFIKPTIDKEISNIKNKQNKLTTESCYEDIAIVNDNLVNQDTKKNYININKILIHNINIISTTKCWWCHYSFTTPSIQLPEEYHNNTFFCIGNFCSFNCAKSYNLNINDSLLWKRCSLLNLLYFQTYNKYVDIKPAASWLILTDYGGNLSIEEFRNNFIFNAKEYLVLHPPLISRQMQIEESYKINKTPNVPIGKLNKLYSEIDSELQLKRVKPMTTNLMNLETTMGLTRTKK